MNKKIEIDMIMVRVFYVIGIYINSHQFWNILKYASIRGFHMVCGMYDPGMFTQKQTKNELSKTNSRFERAFHKNYFQQKHFQKFSISAD